MEKAVEASSAASSTDRRQWGRILNALVTMLKQQESQIETLVHERQYLQEYIQRQKIRGNTKSRLLQSQISQMRRTEELEKRVKEAKSEVLLGLKDRDVALIKNLVYEQSERDLANFHKCIEDFGPQLSEVSEKSGNDDLEVLENGNKAKHDHLILLQAEMQKLKIARKKIVYKDSKNLALLAEKDFIWNQFNKLDSDYADLRKSKTIELEQAYEIIEKLQLTIKDLQSSASEKDIMVTKIRDDITVLEMDLKRCSQDANEMFAKHQSEIEELTLNLGEKSKVIAKLRKHQTFERTIVMPQKNLSQNLKVNSTPTVRKQREACSSKQFSSMQNGNLHSCIFGGRTPSQAMVLGRCSTTRERSACTQETPTLFSPRLKIPKLRVSVSNIGERTK